MISCDICGKELKTAQGLRGHKTFVHADTISATGQPVTEQATQQLLGSNSSTRVVSEQQVSLLEDRLQRLERVTGLAKSDLDLSLSETEPLTERLTSITDQVTKLSDTVSKLSEEVELGKATWDTESEEFSKRLTDLREAHNRQSAVINKDRDTFNNLNIIAPRTGKVVKMVEDLDKGLNTIRTKLIAHGHDGLSLIPQLSSGLKQVDEQMAKLQAEVARAKVLAVRKPTDDFERLKLTDGSEHTFRVYEGKMGLSNPHRVSMDLFLDDRYVDLAEPVN